MIPTKPLLLSAAALLTACINLPAIDPPDQTPDSGTPPSLTLTLTAPAGTTYTNGTVSVQLQLQGDTPEQVELLVDDQPLTTLAAPYSFSWDTTSVTEGSHRLAARARIGDKSFTSDVREVVVDRTPPQMASRTPAPSAQDVGVRQPIQATFSEPLKPSTVTSDSVRLIVDENIVPANLSISADARTLTVSPSSQVSAPSSAQVTLTTAISDLAGNPLNIDKAWTWNHPVSLSLGNLGIADDSSGYPTPAYTPHLHLDSAGHPYVVWLEEVDPVSSFYNVHVRRWTGTSWDSVGGAVDPEPLRLGVGTSAPNQIIQTDASGIPFVAWIHNGANSKIQVSRGYNNQWYPLGSPIDFDITSGNPPFHLAFCLDKSNKPIVSWIREESRFNFYVSITQWSGQAWEQLGDPLQLYGILNRDSVSSSLIVDSSGAPVTARPTHGAESSTPKPHGILVQRWNGSQWVSLGQAVTARPQSYNHFPQTPYLLLDASKRINLAWSESDGSTYNVHVYRWNDDFSIWEPLGSPLSANPELSPATNPKLAIDGMGNMFVTWEESNPSTGGYEQHIRRWNGTAWESIGGPILKSGTTYPSFTIDATGNIYFAWADGDVLVHRYNN